MLDNHNVNDDNDNDNGERRKNNNCVQYVLLLSYTAVRYYMYICMFIL